MVGSRTDSASILEFPVRYYQMARMYGPGMAASGREGLHEKLLQKPVGQVGLVSVHCWNLGEESGPYPIRPAARCPGEAADWVPTAHEVIVKGIRPVLDAARGAGIAIFHLAQYVYAPRYPRYGQIAADPELCPPASEGPIEGCVRPRSIEERYRDQYGPDYPGPVWVTHAGKFDIAEAVRPLPDEDVFLDGWQLNGLCRRLDIDTLFYMGFMADLCLVNIPGAIREMANRFRYHCVVLRDCTTAYEFADTFDGKWMNFAAIRLIESDLGYSASSKDFIAAAARVNIT